MLPSFTQVTVLDKSKADWDEHKKDAADAEDLADHNRSNSRFIDKQDFLARRALELLDIFFLKV